MSLFSGGTCWRIQRQSIRQPFWDGLAKRRKMNQIWKNAGKLFVSSLFYCLQIFQNNNVKKNQAKFCPLCGWNIISHSYLHWFPDKNKDFSLSLRPAAFESLIGLASSFTTELGLLRAKTLTYFPTSPPAPPPFPVQHSARHASGLNNKHQWFLCVRHRESP